MARALIVQRIQSIVLFLIGVSCVLCGQARRLLAQEQANGDRTGRIWALDLDTAIRMGLERGRPLAISAYEAAISGTRPTQADGAFDEVLQAKGTLSQLRQAFFSTVPSQFSGLPQGLSVNQVDSLVFDVSLAKTFGWGLQGTLQLQSTRTLTESTVALNPNYQPRLTASITQPLLQGLGAVNEADYEKAVLGHEVSRETFRTQAQDTVKQVIDAYWTYVLARESLTVAQQALSTATDLYENTRAKFERGDAAGIEVQVAEAGVAARREAVIVSQADVANTRDALLLSTRPSVSPADWDIEIQPLQSPEYVEVQVDVERSLQLAIENRAELRQLFLSSRIDRLSLLQAEDALLPALDLFGSASWGGLGRDPDKSFDRLGSGRFYDLSAGLSLRWPMRGRTASGQIEEARLRLAQNRTEEIQLVEGIILEVRRAVRAVETARERIQATRTARLLAERQLEASRVRLDEGVGTSHDVLEFEEELTAARTNEIKALIDYQLALAALDRIQGTNLQTHGIDLGTYRLPE